MRAGPWRVALRLARRDVRRAKGRTALIAAMVGVPVLLIVTLSTLVHTKEISAREGLAAAMGRSQALLTMTGSADPLVQDTDGQSWNSASSPAAPNSPATVPTASPSPTEAQLQALTGGRLLPVFSVQVRLGSTTRAIPVQGNEFDTTDPATRGMAQVVQGRLPRTTSEIALTPALSRLGWPIGQRILDLDTHRDLTVVGTYRTLGMSGGVREALGLPGALESAGEPDYLLVRAQPVTWADVRALNRHGVVVESRAVVEHPPSASELGSATTQFSDTDNGERSVVGIIVVAVVIEVVLLAGPAFAVGVRRRRRDLALLGATGGSPRDLRRTVLVHAGLLGVGSAALGAVLGLPAAALAEVVLERFGAGFGPYDWRWREVLLTLALGAVATVLAALAPAVQAAREDVATVLAGRRGVVRNRRGWPLLGVGLMALGAAVVLTRGTRAGGEVWVGGATVVLVLGAVATTPWLVGRLTRLARPLPLPLRLAARDAGRQPGRTAPAVAAIMASVIGITALAIGFASDSEQSKHDYTAQTAPGIATVGLPDDTEASRSEVAAVVGEVLPGRPLATGYVVQAPVGSGDSAQLLPAARGCTPAQSILGAASTAACLQQAQDGENAVVRDVVAAYEPQDLAAYGIHLSAHQGATLRDGGALTFVAGLPSSGRLTIGVVTGDDPSDQQVARQVSLPVAAGPAAGRHVDGPAAVIMTPETARRLGLSAQPERLAIGGAELTSSQQSRLSGRLQVIGTDVYVERGYQQRYGLILGLLALIGSLVVVVATITATGLAMSEARPDLSTLGAIGAPPRTRRLVAAGQSLLVGLVGTVLGVVLGFVPGLAVTWPLTSQSFTVSGSTQGSELMTPHTHGPTIAIPWLMLLGIVVGVPLLAAIVTGVCTRARLPMVRRLAA